MMCIHHHRGTRWCLALCRLLSAALAGTVLASGALGAEREGLDLNQAAARVLAGNPALQVFEFRLQGLTGERLSADQAAPLELGLEAENLLGSGALRGTDAADYTLSIGSVIELGGKRDARLAVVNSRYERLAAQRRAEALALLGEVTRQFVTTLALQEKLALAATAVELAQTSHDIVRSRARKGGAPDAEVLRARAALRQAELGLAQLQTLYDTRKRALALLLDTPPASIQRLRGDLFQFSPSDSFEQLMQRAMDNPALQIYASESALRDAELELARSRSSGDISWQLGARYLEESGDSGLVANVAIPLFSAGRNRGAVQAARAARDEVGPRREVALRALQATLYEAYRGHQQDIETVTRVRTEVLPDLTEALTLTRTAYEQGRYSYVEWLAAQRELLAAREALVDTAASALLHQALIEQLTARPMGAPSGANPRQPTATGCDTCES